MGRRNIRLATAFLAILLMALPFAASGARSEWRHLQAEDGLSDLLVNSIFRDNRGYVWFGTGVGLDRFDGNRIRRYAFADGTPRRVLAIAEGPEGEIYAGSHTGLSRAGEASLETVLVEHINFRVNTLAYDGAGTLYIGSDRGLLVYRPGNGSLDTIHLHPDIFSEDNEVTAINISPRGLWLSTRSALHLLNPADKSSHRYPFHDSGVAKRMLEVGGKLYIGMYGGGIAVFDIESRRFGNAIAVGNNLVTWLEAGFREPGMLYAPTDGEGLYAFRAGDNEAIPAILPGTDGGRLRSNSIYSLLVDRDGTPWVGYYQAGVDYIPHSRDLFDVYYREDFIDTSEMAVRAICIEEGRKLIGTREGLYYIDEHSGRTAAFCSPAIRSNLIFCITPWRGRYYVGTYGGGMYVFDPATLHLTEFAATHEVFTRGDIFTIAIDSADTMWVGTSEGLFRFDGERQAAHYTRLNSQLPAGNVYEIFFDSQGRGWICTENGMAVWTGRELSRDRFPRDFVHDSKIRDVFEDSRNELYFVPDRGRIFRSNLAMTRYGYLENFQPGSSGACTFVTEDRDGNLWFGGETGLYRLDRKGALTHLNRSDGLPDPVFTLCPPAVDSRGDIWMGNSHGLVRLDYNRFKSEQETMRRALDISDVELNGINATGRLSRNGRNYNIDAEADERSISICFNNPECIDPHFQQVEWRSGNEENWHLTPGTDAIRIFDLPEGRTTIELRSHGNSEHATTLTVRRAKAFNWFTFAILVLLAMAAGLSAHFYRRYRRHHLKLQELEEEAATRLQAENSRAEEQKLKRYRTSRIADKECRQIVRALDELMRTTKPYTNPDLKISDLAAMTGRSSHDLSFIFNQHMQQSFYDYINRWRVDEFKSIVAGSDASRYTLTALSQMCGFSSRASFFRHFKAIAGMTPAEYLKNVK